MENIPSSLQFFVPINLDLTIIPEYKEKHQEKYLWFIHSILFKSLTTKNDFSGYVNLQTDLLKKYIGSTFFKDVKSRLVEHGIIEINKKYSPGAFSKSYRLTDEYRNEKIKAIDITKKTYCRKIYNSKSKYLEDVFKNNALLKKEFLAMTYARIDYDSALEYINNNYDQNSPQYKSRLIALIQFNKMYLTDFSTKRFNIDFTFVENKGRVYTPYTMLSRDLEQFVYFTGYESEPSITLDMPNSQLCFYSELIERRKKVDYIGSNSDNKIVNKNKRIIKSINISGYTDVFSYLKISIPYVVYFSPNWEDYIFNGYGYERMMYLCKWKNKEHSHTKEERQEFKEVFFGQLFYNKYDERLTDLEMIFYSNHTKTAMELRKLKQKLGNKLLAIEVQKLESDFFHKILVGYIVKKYPNIPFIIKHDSITLPKSEALIIADELNELVKDFFRCDSLKLKMS